MRAITPEENVSMSTEIADIYTVIYSKLFPGEHIRTGNCGWFLEET